MLEEVRTRMAARLDTRERVERAAEAIGVSPATVYRYKAAPETIPLGKFSGLVPLLGYSLGEGATWDRSEFVEAEQRRLDYEEALADGGFRLTVTPAFTVTCQLPEVSQAIMDFDHGVHRRDLFARYQALRSRRGELYREGAYQSFEIVNGRSYLDFWSRRGRYHALSEGLRDRQVKALVETAQLEHVQRRVFLASTPEIPIITYYSIGVAVARLDDFVMEFTNAEAVRELSAVVSGFWDRCHIQPKDEVIDFFRDPARYVEGGQR